MDPLRAERYRDKLHHADRRLGQVAEWRDAARDDERSRLARYHAFQEAAEATTDLAAMVVSDLGKRVEDDYRNLETLVEAGIVSRELLRGLVAAAGLRNRIVHEYNGLDEPKADAAMERLSPVIRRYLEEVERWLTPQK